MKVFTTILVQVFFASLAIPIGLGVRSNVEKSLDRAHGVEEVDGVLLDAFLVAWKDTQGESSLSREQKKISNYSFSFLLNKDGYVVVTYHVKRPDKARLGALHESGVEFRYTIDVEHRKILERGVH